MTKKIEKEKNGQLGYVNECRVHSAHLVLTYSLF